MNPAAPYPADARAKGWRFELDYERIGQSGTWALAAQPGKESCRPLLLMQWLVAWTQEPCGTLPNDEEVISALIGVGPKVWAKHRAILMRGWWLADDGLLYHPTITKRVLEMLEYRRKTAERVAKHKAEKREQQIGNVLPTVPITVKNDTGTGTGTSISKEEREWVNSASARALSKQAAEAMAKAGNVEAVATNPQLLHLLFLGMTVGELETAAAESRGKSNAFTYAMARAIGKREDAARIGTLPPLKTASADPDSRSAVEAEAKAKGIKPWDEISEQWPAYKARVRAAKAMEAA